jgi:hypothetical protein
MDRYHHPRFSARPHVGDDSDQQHGTAPLEVLSSAAEEFEQRAADGAVPVHLVATAAVVYPCIGLYLIWKNRDMGVRQQLAWTAASVATAVFGLRYLPRTTLTLLVLSGYVVVVGTFLADRDLSGTQKLGRLLVATGICLLAIVGLFYF